MCLILCRLIQISLILHWTPELRDEAEAVAPYTKGFMKFVDGAPKEAEQEFRAALGKIRL